MLYAMQAGIMATALQLYYLKAAAEVVRCLLLSQNLGLGKHRHSQYIRRHGVCPVPCRRPMSDRGRKSTESSYPVAQWASRYFTG